MLLELLSIDIVERIVVLTDTNRDYETICQLIERLKESHRRKRIIEAITKREVDKEGTVRYRLDGKLHRENDKPAVECADGMRSWYCKGQLHRDNDKPAYEDVDGEKIWFYNGQRHRENDKPAIEKADGTKMWYYNDAYHRENDKPAIEYADGMKNWWLNGKRIK